MRSSRPWNDRGWWSHHLRISLRWVSRWVLGVPVRVKMAGMVLLPVLILGFAINFWVRNSLSDWLSWLLDSQRVQVAMQVGGRSVMLVTLLAAGMSLLLSSLLMLLLTNPILELKRVADQVRGGALDKRAPVRSRDEIGQVAESFNRMVDQLVRSQRALERSNRRLSSLCHVASSVGRGLELGPVLDAALNSTLEVVGLESGWIYLRDPDGDRFYLASAVAPPADIQLESYTFPGTFCGCQRALLAEDDWLAPTVRRCRRGGNGNVPAGEELRHFSVPLRARGMTLGVLNLVWTKDSPASDEELDLLEVLGAQVSEAVANARLHADLLEKEAGMEVLLDSLVTAQEDERSLIASELHDGAGQELTSVLLRLKSLESKGEATELKAGISDLCLDLSLAIEHIRSLSHQLRPPDLEHLGLGPTLRNLMADMLAESGLQVEFHSDLNGARLEPATEITLYRIAQEALMNITRHAQAAAAKLTLTVENRDLQLVIEDDGQGFDPDRLTDTGETHIGLASIQERAERLGGSFVVATAPGQGTRLTVRIPCEEVSG